MTVSLPTQRDRLGLGATQVDKVTGHVISHQLSDKSRPAILFQQEQPGLLCMRPGSAESRVSAVLLLGTSSPSRQFILAQVQDETLTPPPPPPRLEAHGCCSPFLAQPWRANTYVVPDKESGRGEGQNQRPLPRAFQGKEEVRFIRPWVGIRDKRAPHPMPGHNLTIFALGFGLGFVLQGLELMENLSAGPQGSVRVASLSPPGCPRGRGSF